MELFVEPPSTSIERSFESGREEPSFSPKQPAKVAENMRKTNIPARVYVERMFAPLAWHC
jgi:hypothetical protein